MADASLPALHPLNRVEQQLVAAATGGPEQQKAFEVFVLDETFYAATPEAPEQGGPIVAKPGATLRFLTVPLGDGRQATALFTAIERVAAAFGPVGYVAIQGRLLLETIRKDPVVLNPGQAYGVIWEPATIAAMLGLPYDRVIDKDTRVLLGHPKDHPAELVERLSAVFSAMPGIEAVWLALAAWPGSQSQAWYLDVRVDAADDDLIRRALAQALEGADRAGYPLDMVVNPAGGPEGVGIAVVHRRVTPPPARRRGLGRLFGR